MKIKALIAAVAMATVSTAAVADTTTPTGEIVMIEKNQGVGVDTGLLITLGVFTTLVALAAGSDT